jgi:thioester reductase-like protein
MIDYVVYANLSGEENGLEIPTWTQLSVRMDLIWHGREKRPL